MYNSYEDEQRACIVRNVSRGNSVTAQISAFLMTCRKCIPGEHRHRPDAGTGVSSRATLRILRSSLHR